MTPPAGHWADDPDRVARVALSFLVEPRHPTVCRLVGAQGALATLEDVRAGRVGGDTEIGARLPALDVAALVASVDRAAAQVLVPGDPGWPDVLDRVEGPPFCLYVRGDADLAAVSGRAVAIVGSRAATEYGESVARDLAEGLGGRGWAVVSGAAYGIDVAAHRGALAVAGPTVAVLACGVDRAYPTSHHAVLEAIAGTGAVVSEVPPGSVPYPRRFLARNRIIAALARATVVVEASLRSGAASTAKEASRLHLPVGAVPGPVTSAMSAGCHDLVRKGVAVVVTDVDEVLELAAPMGEMLLDPRTGASRDTDVLSAAELDVLAALPLRGGIGAERVAVLAGVAVPTVHGALGTLDALGFVVRTDDGWRARGRPRRRSPSRDESGDAPG